MRRIDRDARAADKAKGFRPSLENPESVRRPSDELSPRPVDHIREAGAALELMVRSSRLKPGELAGEFDLRRSRFYDRLKDPGTLQLKEILPLAENCPDPEFIDRFCGHLLAWKAAKAVRDSVRARVVIFAGEIGVKTAADAESIRRATGQQMPGDD